ncbi:hypothetical protein GE21DRAFT_1055193 [Neurospora crassa]|nr:hypothetical protein GE21DRAFT_1055193 [Neurospora crassa]
MTKDMASLFRDWAALLLLLLLSLLLRVVAIIKVCVVCMYVCSRVRQYFLVTVLPQPRDGEGTHSLLVLVFHPNHSVHSPFVNSVRSRILFRQYLAGLVNR